MFEAGMLFFARKEREERETQEEYMSLCTRCSENAAGVVVVWFE